LSTEAKFIVLNPYPDTGQEKTERRLFINLTPFIPLSIIGIYIPIMRGEVFGRGGSPLSNLHFPFPY
jgi:hypothetical protein